MEKIVDYVNMKLDDKYKSPYCISNLKPTKDEIEEMISLVNRGVVIALIRKYNPHLYGKINEDVIDIILKKWAIAKFPFYCLFGRKFTYGYECDFKVEKRDFERKLHEMLSTTSVVRNKAEGKVTVDTSHFRYYKPIIDLFSMEVLESNQCPDDDFIKDLISTYKPGQKLSRFFSSFFNDKEFDIEYSKLFQHKNNDETIVMSIAIEDFLSASYNHDNWATCLSPVKLHSSGVLELCFDKASICCYVSHKNMEIERGVSWNSKIIRNFIYFNTDNSSFGVARCYPNVQNMKFYNCVKNGMQKCVSEYFSLEQPTWYTVETIKNIDSTSCNEEYELSHDLQRVHVDSKKRYCTSRSSMFFVDPIRWFTSLEPDTHSRIYVGTPKSVCVICGCETDKFQNGEFICGHCMSNVKNN